MYLHNVVNRRHVCSTDIINMLDVVRFRVTSKATRLPFTRRLPHLPLDFDALAGVIAREVKMFHEGLTRVMHRIDKASFRLFHIFQQLHPQNEDDRKVTRWRTGARKVSPLLMVG